jgi:hypothetical protein
MFADERGRCEFRCEFDPTNVGSSGLSITDFQIACLTAETNEGKFDIPLVGFKDAFAKDYGIDWKSAGFDAVEANMVEEKITETEIHDVIITKEEKEELYKTDSEPESEITYFTVDINTANVIYDADDEYKVSMKELLANEYGLFDLVNNPTVLYNYHKNGYFMFSHHGESGKRFGVPSSYSTDDAEYMRGLGFDRFANDFAVHNENYMPKNGDFGYWMKNV